MIFQTYHVFHHLRVLSVYSVLIRIVEAVALSGNIEPHANSEAKGFGLIENIDDVALTVIHPPSSKGIATRACKRFQLAELEPRPFDEKGRTINS